jgi:hypothetical protein
MTFDPDFLIPDFDLSDYTVDKAQCAELADAEGIA